MSHYDEYRRQAEICRKQAERAKFLDDKSYWLRLAEDWLNLLPKTAHGAQERFDEEVRARGTHQDVTDQKQ